MPENIMRIIYDTIYRNKGANQAQQDIDKVSQKTEKMNSTLSTAFNVGKFAVFGAAIRKATSYIGESVKKSADYIETLNVLQVAFDGNTESIRKFSSQLADTLNLDDSTILDAASKFKMLSKSMGLANETGEKLSELMTKMTLDYASLFNYRDINKAQNVLQNAMQGYGKSLKQRSGVSVLETTVQTTLDTLGVDAYVEDMNDAEKALARVISMEYQLMSSQGDLARTIEAPANQMRVMKEQLSMLARNIGNVFLPAVAAILPYLNAFLIVLNAIISALARLVGYKEDMFDTFEETGGAIDYFTGVGDAIDGVGKSAENTAKKMQGLRGFDKLNVIKTPTESSGAGGGVGGAAGGINPNLLKAFNTMADKYKMKLDEVKTKATEISEKILEWLGFQKRINEETGKVEWYFAGISTGASKISKHISNIGESIINIFGSPEVQKAGEMWANSFIVNFKKVVNSIAKIGSNIAESLVGSIDIYLSKNGKRIKNFITDMFTINRKNLQITGMLSEAFAEISNILKNDIAKQIGADIIAMFANPLMSVTQLLSQWATDLYEVFAYPIISNIDQIKETFESMLEPIQTVTGTLSEAFTYVGDTITQLYNEHFKPFYDNVKEGLSDTFKKFLDVYNEYFAPFFKDLTEDFKVLWDNHLKPLWDKIIVFVGWIVDNIKDMWNNVLKPVVDWIIQNILPKIIPVLTTIKNHVFNTIALIADIIGSLIQIIKGVIDFIAGAFTGDWKRVWNGLVSIFKGIIDGLIGIFKYPLNTIIDGINTFTRELNKIKIPDWVPAVGGKSINIPRIQKLAEGGMPDVGQMFIANEKGPELVGEIGGQSFVANQNQMLDIIDKKLQNAGGLKNATFIVQVGNKEIAKQVITDLQEMAKDNGKPITIGG